MELADFAVNIEEVLNETTSKYECVMTDENDIGKLWTFLIEDSISGYIGVEDNEDGIDIRTVSIGLHLKDITDISKEELLGLFELNSELINANFSVVKYPVSKKSEDDDQDEMVEVESGEELSFNEDEEEPELRDLLIIQTRIPYEAFSVEDFEPFIKNLMFQADMLLDNEEDNEETGSTEL